MTDLPQPRTVTDELLVAIYDRLGELLERSPARQEVDTPAGSGPVEVAIQEPAAARRRS